MTDVDRDSELSLVSRLRAGEPDAVDEAYRAFNGRLFAFLARLSRSRELAEDLAEETWLKLVSHTRHLRPDTELARWLYTVGRNLYFSYSRSRALDSGVWPGLDFWPHSIARSSPFEETAANETARRVERALASLPSMYREVLILVGVEGLTPTEAAVICGVTPESLRQRLHRARALLSERMQITSEATVVRTSEALP
jgi:RNA polymerase sigma-70 factor, ECF subfamily